jgi:two-component system cell cycle sensor histidine kinase/response regulator CckA
VDDQPTIRRLAELILSEAGYRVFEAADARQALDLLTMARGRVDLLIVDVVLPYWDGVELARRARRANPDQRVLYMSGYPAQILMQYGLVTLDAPFLAKPFTRKELLTKVREALERWRVDRSPIPLDQ